MEAPKDPASYGLLTYAWVVGLSILGGVVSFTRKLRDGNARAFNVIELIGEICTSGFAGLLTFWLTQAAGFNPLVSAVMIGVAGHMGSRAMFLLEKWFEGRFPHPPQP